MADGEAFFSELCGNPYFAVYWPIGLPPGEALLSMKCRLPYGVRAERTGKGRSREGNPGEENGVKSHKCFFSFNLIGLNIFFKRP